MGATRLLFPATTGRVFLRTLAFKDCTSTPKFRVAHGNIISQNHSPTEVGRALWRSSGPPGPRPGGSCIAPRRETPPPLRAARATATAALTVKNWYEVNEIYS